MLVAASKAKKRKALNDARIIFPDSPGWLYTRKSESEVRACKAIANEARRSKRSNNNGWRSGGLKEGAVLDTKMSALGGLESIRGGRDQSSARAH